MKMSNTITHRIYDFLKEHPPFSFVSKDDLLEISSQISVLYLESGKILFSQGEKPPGYFYVVREGAVQLYNEFKSEKILIDICDEGDIFGIRPLISTDQLYTLTAVVSEEALVYQIPTSAFGVIMQNNKGVENYFSSSFAAGVRNPYAKYSKQRIFDSGEEYLKEDTDLTEVQTVKYNQNIITCFVDTSIQNAAKIMRDNRVGSIVVVNGNQNPIGIITDRDLRNKVVAGDLCIDCEIKDIMSSPVITAHADSTAADLQILMIKKNIHHICITENGTPNSKMVGMVSEHDILVLYGNNPSVFIREIKRAKEVTQLEKIRYRAEQLLKKYLKQEVSISYISRIMTEINNAINIRAIELTITILANKGKTTPNIKWCWLALGSQGREEQLLRSDQDNAIVFEDVSEKEYKNVKSYFLDLAKGVTEILNKCGFSYCPADMMASNERWCLSLKQWNEQFNTWIYTPSSKAVMYSTIFFDFNPIFGDFELAEKMADNIYKSINNQESFLSFLAKNALESPPPLSFFREFMVEHNGEHKNEFDIKARAMMPLVDGARVLTLAARIKGINSTIKRYDKLAEYETENKELFEQLADAYEIVMRFRAMQGLKHNNSGRYFRPEELNKMQRLMLRNCFRPIKELQTILTVRFNLKMFR
ncbi:MAG: CBS domain-containing protein [Ignavibacteriae bacterium]|nr:CBS domain-containing protein [Ignavibacteriota bacterium]